MITWKKRIKYRLFAIALWLAPLAGLMGCGSMPSINVLGGCEMPSQYDVIKTGPADLTALDLKGHFEQEAQERHEHKVDANDFNGLHDYVRDNCK